MKGIKRFRQAIKNQRDTGEGEFRLTYGAAEDIAAEIEDEYGWAAGVPVPRDADGEVVPLTTRLMYTNKGEIIRVWDTCFDGHAWYVKGIDKGKLYLIGKLHLAQPDSWKKLEEDVQKVTETGDICGYYDKVGKPCNGCPARNIPGVCSGIVLRDALRRAKALAGRGED